MAEKASVVHADTVEAPTRPADKGETPGSRRPSLLHRNPLEHDPEWTGDDVDFSHINEKKVLRKMDLRLIPTLALLYLLSFLDRGNIGNANIQGLSEDLHLTGPQYNWCLTVFFFTYCAFEVPSNVMLKRLRPSIWLPSIMVAWGVCTMCMGFVQNYHGLLAVRLMLGVCEAGLFPGVAYYITEWYVREEAQYRQTLFFSAASVAGAFSGLLAYAIAHMNGVAGYKGWRWIFILEGLLTIIVAFSAYFLLFDFPDTATFLSHEERAWVVHRLRYQGVNKGDTQVAQSADFSGKYIKAAFLDWQIYVGLVMYWGIVCPLYGISLFLPTIIKDLGYVAETAQLLTIPIYLTAAAAAITMAWISDRHGQRSPFVFGAMCLIAAGFIICIVSVGRGVPGVVYAGVFIAVLGIYPAFPGNVTWISNNLAGSTKRAAGMAIHIGAGNLAGAMASNFYRKKDAPKYYLGHALELGFASAGLIAVLVLRFSYKNINKKRERQGTGTLTAQQLSEMGDKSPSFRYVL